MSYQFYTGNINLKDYDKILYENENEIESDISDNESEFISINYDTDIDMPDLISDIESDYENINLCKYNNNSMYRDYCMRLQEKDGYCLEHYTFMNNDFEYFKFNLYIISYIIIYYIYILNNKNYKCECGNEAEPDEDLCKMCILEQHSDCLVSTYVEYEINEDDNLNINFDETILYVKHIKDIEERLDSNKKYKLFLNRKIDYKKKGKLKICTRNSILDKKYLYSNLNNGNKIINDNNKLYIINKNQNKINKKYNDIALPTLYDAQSNISISDKEYYKEFFDNKYQYIHIDDIPSKFKNIKSRKFNCSKCKNKLDIKDKNDKYCNICLLLYKRRIQIFKQLLFAKYPSIKHKINKNIFKNLFISYNKNKLNL